MADRRITAPLHLLGKAAQKGMLPLARAFSRFETLKGAYAQGRLEACRNKLARGDKAYVVGIGSGGHNSGVGIVSVSADEGIQLIGNHEEERFRGIKHFQKYPSASVEVLVRQLRELNVAPSEVDAVCASWDYPAWAAKAFQTIVEELPGSLGLLRQGASPHMNLSCLREARSAPQRLGSGLFGNNQRAPIISLRHHDNHAWLSWGCSPFAHSKEPVIVLVVDGAGDDGAISSYLAKEGNLQLLSKNDCLWDSLGMTYGMLSSALGGWPMLSSEGRYMGASAWGDTNRLTNPYYARLRDVLVLESDGRVFLNRTLANWHRAGGHKPFSSRLTKIIGAPILPDRMWNPDAVLQVEGISHAPITVDRLNKAAAVQLVFEDALFHIVQHLIRTTRSTKLVLTGGTALNCVANMLLLENFNSEWYERNLGVKNETLHLWIPPIPGDMGAAIGAAYHFACLAGGKPTGRFPHAFLCGLPITRAEIQEAIREDSSLRAKWLGNIENPADRDSVADLMAWIVSRNGIIGVCQGAAETGPRALGHRSILANPTNPETREMLNERVKFRELIRPLAPMVTRETAHRWFKLERGASDGDFNAYNYMVMTARAMPEAFQTIPAVIHKDGTCRVQIVREENDALTYSYLKALGRYTGAEVSVNTSLNVGAPIAQTARQALDTLRRSHGMHGLFIISREGDVFLAWHHVNVPPKDEGQTLKRWLCEWQPTTNGSQTHLATSEDDDCTPTSAIDPPLSMPQFFQATEPIVAK